MNIRLGRLVGLLAIGTALCSCIPRAQSQGQSALRITPREKLPTRAFIGIDPVPLELELTVPVPVEPADVTVTAVLANSDGAAVDTKRIALPITGGRTYALPFLLMPTDYGYYTASVTASAPDGKVLATYGTSLAVLQPLTDRQQKQDPRKSIFGVNLHFDQGQGDLSVIPQLMNMAGVRWIRDSIDWRTVEASRDQYTIKPYLKSAYTLALRRYGIRTLEILCYDNPLYPHGTPEEAQAFGKYAEYVSKELGDTVEHFEIWNEPNGFAKLSPEQYVPVLRSGYEGVKKGNSKAFVVGIGGASPGGWSGHYIPEIRKQGAAVYMDSFSIHPYTAPSTCDVGYRTEGAPSPAANLEAAGPLTSGFADDIRKAHKLKDTPGIWITELGWPSQVNGLMGQAQQVARAYAMTAALPNLYSRLFLYDFLCDGSNPKESEHNFGVIGNDYSVRPSYVALAAVSRAIEGRPFLRRIAHPEDAVRLYLFGPEDDAVLVAWVTELGPSELIAGKLRNGKPLRGLTQAGSWLNRRLPVELGVTADHVQIHDWQDRVKQVATDGGRLRLELSTWPAYIHHVGDPGKISVGR